MRTRTSFPFLLLLLRREARRLALKLSLGLALGLAGIGAAQAGLVQLSNWAISFGQVDPSQGGIVTLHDLGGNNEPIASFQVRLAGFGDGLNPISGWISALEDSAYRFDAVDLLEIGPVEFGTFTYYTTIGKGQNMQAPTLIGGQGLINPLGVMDYGVGVIFSGVGLDLQTAGAGNNVPEPGSAGLLMLALFGAWAAGVRKRRA